MMGLGFAGGHDFVPDLGGEGDVYQIIAVDVANFSPSQQVFSPTEAMGVSGNTRPAQYLLVNDL